MYTFLSQKIAQENHNKIKNVYLTLYDKNI